MALGPLLGGILEPLGSLLEHLGRLLVGFWEATLGQVGSKTARVEAKLASSWAK